MLMPFEAFKFKQRTNEYPLMNMAFKSKLLMQVVKQLPVEPVDIFKMLQEI